MHCSLERQYGSQGAESKNNGVLKRGLLKGNGVLKGQTRKAVGCSKGRVEEQCGPVRTLHPCLEDLQLLHSLTRVLLARQRITANKQQKVGALQMCPAQTLGVQIERGGGAGKMVVGVRGCQHHRCHPCVFMYVTYDWYVDLCPSCFRHCHHQHYLGSPVSYWVSH